MEGYIRESMCLVSFHAAILLRNVRHTSGSEGCKSDSSLDEISYLQLILSLKWVKMKVVRLYNPNE